MPFLFRNLRPKLNRGYIVVEATFLFSAFPSEQPSRQSFVEGVPIVLLRASSQAAAQSFIGGRQIGDYIFGTAKSRQDDFATRAASFDRFEKNEPAMSTEYQAARPHFNA